MSAKTGPDRPVLLKVEDLSVSYRLSEGQVEAVDGVSFELDRGETLGLVGESGCGKTTAAMAVIRLLPDNGRVTSGRALFDGTDLLQMAAQELRKYRWARISVIFQGAMNSLNPVQRVGDQLVSALMLHGIPRKEAEQRAAEMFQRVGLEASRLTGYPHEFSGGMRQRALIALALLLGPDIVICDEPTTALDVVVQDQVVETLKHLQQRYNQGMIIISHDISVIAETCGSMAVMYAGQLVEYGGTVEIFENPGHPYTAMLLRSFPSIKGELRELLTIAGAPPDLSKPPGGCRFHPRCPLAEQRCRDKRPPARSLGSGRHTASCHFAGQFTLDDIQKKEAGRR